MFQKKSFGSFIAIRITSIVSSGKTTDGRNLRILLVSQYFWPENFRLNELVAELCKRGHEVTVLTGKPNYPEGRVYTEYLNNPAAFVTYEGAVVVRVPIFPRGTRSWQLLLNYISFPFSASLLGIWKLRGRKFDIVLSIGLSPAFASIPACVVRWVKDAPHVLWILDLWPDTLRAVGVIKSEFILMLVGRVVGWIYNRTDLILAQSKSFRNNILKYAPQSAEIDYFPAWADEIFDNIELDYRAPEVAYRPHIFTVMFAGNVGEAQDFPAVICAAELLRDRPDIRWVIVGDGREAGWVKQEILQRGLQEKVLMVGRHPQSRMPEFFAHANALLVSLKRDPTFAMTIPGKVQSYLASGIPVLAMLDGEGAKVIEEAGAGLVCNASDSIALAKNVVELAQADAHSLQQYGIRGRAYYKSNFRRSTLVDKLENWLTSLAKAH
jgi:glycosyltransferase involved in cell wall biosynthesis